MIRSSHIALLSISLAFGVVALSAQTARAQDQAAVDKLVQMNKKALDDYDTLDWDAAKRILLDALVAGKKAGLDNHPVMGRTYIHLGAVYITGFKDRQKGLQSFQRALEIDPTIQLSKGIETTEVTATFAEAQRGARSGASAGGGGGDDNAPVSKKKRRGPVMEGDSASSDDHPKPKKHRPSGDEEPDLPAHIGALDCPEPDEAIIDKPLTVRCVVAPNLPVASVYLMYRAPGGDEYNEVLMTKSPKGWLQAKIPKKAVTGKSIQFYFEGRNGAGKPVVANGGADSPNIVLVVEEESKGEASKAGTGEEDENPLEENEGNQRPRLHLGHVDKEREGLDTRFGKRKWWIGIGVGTGYGYAKGNGFEAVNKSLPQDPFHSLQSQFTPGLAWAGIGQLEPEIRLRVQSQHGGLAGRSAAVHRAGRQVRELHLQGRDRRHGQAALLHEAVAAPVLHWAAGGRRRLPLPRLSRRRQQQRLLRLQGHHRGRPPPDRRGGRSLLRGGQVDLAGHRDQRDCRVADLRSRHGRQLRAAVQYLRGPTAQARCRCLVDGVGSRRAKIISR